MGNAVECSHPPLGSCERDAEGAHDGARFRGVEKNDALLADLRDLLQRQCEQLGNYVDERLTRHHQDLLRSLQDDRPDLLSPPSPLMRHVRSSSPRPGRKASDEAKNFFEAFASTRSQDNPVRKEDTDGKQQWLCTFEESEEKQKNRSLQIKRNTSDSTARGPSKETAISREEVKQGLRRLIEAPCFEAFICLLIMSNVVFLGVEVQESMGDREQPELFKVAELAYTAFFTVELLLRFGAYGCKPFLCGEERLWNCLDCMLVFISVLDVVLEALQGNSSDNFAYARIIRMFRTVRIFRVVRLMKFFRPLRILFYSVLNTVRSLCWTLILLAIIIYIFGVIFTMAASQALVASAEDFQVVEPFFGSLWTSIATLFQSITGGLDWHVLTKSLGVLSPSLVALFLAFITFSHLAFLNVVTGVVCHGAMESAQQDQDILVQSQLAAKEVWIKQLEDVFYDIDRDQSGAITLKEFERRLQQQELQDYFSAMDLTTDEAWSLFKLLDSNSSYTIDLDEFVTGCLRLRGTARSIDVHMLMYESKWTMRKLSVLTRAIEDLQDFVLKRERKGLGPRGEKIPSDLQGM